MKPPGHVQECFRAGPGAQAGKKVSPTARILERYSGRFTLQGQVLERYRGRFRLRGQVRERYRRYRSRFKLRGQVQERYRGREKSFSNR